MFSHKVITEADWIFHDILTKKGESRLTGGEEKNIPRKAAALIRPIVDMEGVEEVDLGGDEEENGESEKTEQ